MPFEDYPTCRSYVPILSREGEMETISHLFFSCHIFWSLWCTMLDLWNFQWFSQNIAVSFFKAWCGFPTYELEVKLSVSIYFAIIWKIW